MLNWHANTFRISGKNITKSGLRRTKILTWLTLMIVPLEVLDTDWIDNSENVLFLGLIGIVMIVALIGLIGLLLSPLVHRFWARDKYLDEWEIDVKRKGMAAGYKVLFGAIFIGLAYSALTMAFSSSETPEFSHFQLDSLGFALLILAFGVQTLTQLSLIRPIDEDDLEEEASTRSPIWARIAVVFAILMIFFGAPFLQGVVDGVKDGMNDTAPSQNTQPNNNDGGSGE